MVAPDAPVAADQAAELAEQRRRMVPRAAAVLRGKTVAVRGGVEW